MQVKPNNRFFTWLGAAAFGTGIGMAIGVVLGLLIGGGAGGWFWYSMATDGMNALSDDTETLFGFVLTVVMALGGVMIGIIGGGVVGFIISSLFSTVPPKS